MNSVTTMNESVELPAFDPDARWWQPDPASRLEARQVARALDCDELVALRLVMLGSSAQEVADYLNPAPKHVLSPEDTCPGMNAAARALLTGIERGETIAIYGDYDVDGATSLAIIRDTLEALDADVFVGSANAVSGFGLTRAFVDAARDEGAKWLITVDCGSTQTDPVKLAQSHGMQVIVIDHHDVDPDNSVDYHLNPRLRSIGALRELAFTLHEHSDSRQKLDPAKHPGEQIAKLTERSTKILVDELGRSRFDELCDLAKRHWTNTGSVLTWKFAAQMLIQRHGKVPAQHWGRPMYLAGLGAVADMAPLNDQEIRTFVRVPTDPHRQRTELRNRRVVPRGVELLCDELGENPLRPDNMIRSKALMNLPKRTALIGAEAIQTVLRSDDEQELRALIPGLVADYERISAMRREVMDPDAIEQVNEAKARGDETFFHYAVIEGHEDYAGFSRMVANTLSRLGKPAIVFVRKTVKPGQDGPTDEFGQELFKFSGANANVPEAHLGELITDEAMRKACTVQMRDWLGQPDQIVNLGGHLEVASGVVTRDGIQQVIAACEAWAEQKKAKRKWRPVSGSRARVIARKLDDTRFARVERECELLAPFSFPHAPMPVVSLVGSISDLEVGEDTRMHAVLTTDDGMERAVTLHAEAEQVIRAYPTVRFECALALGNPDSPYFIRHLVAVPD
jgi:single-stranded DNA-specific DHH superfamily exonuclease